MILCSYEAMNAKIEKLAKLEASARELNREIEAVRDEIKLNLSGPEVVETDKYVIRWQEVPQNRFDVSAFKRVHSALYEMFLKPITANRFSYADR